MNMFPIVAIIHTLPPSKNVPKVQRRSRETETEIAAVTALCVHPKSRHTPASSSSNVHCTVDPHTTLIRRTIRGVSMSRRNPPRPRFNTSTRQLPLHQADVDRSVATTNRSAGWNVVVAGLMLLRWRILEEEVLCGVPVHREVSGSPAAVAVLVRALGEAVLFGGVVALLLVLVLVLVLGVVLVLTLSLAVVSVLRR